MKDRSGKDRVFIVPRETRCAMFVKGCKQLKFVTMYMDTFIVFLDSIHRPASTENTR
jgi:hypothetical protein